MHESDAVAPERIAMLVAPAVDRLRLAISRGFKEWMPQYVADLAIGAAAGNVLGNIRNLTPGRTVDRSAVLAVYSYDDPAQIGGGVDELVAVGILHEDAGRLQLSDRGADVVADVQAEGARIVTDL